MAVIKKTLFAENLDRYQTFVTDTNPTSEYFKITELSDTFTGGKNAFLIQGSDYLVPDTLIKIEIKDSKGNIIYHEPGEGIVSSSVDGAEIVTEYYEGVSKVVAVHIYPDTSYGPATITILGELSSYNSSGLNSPIPLEWEGKYNVKWQRQINTNPSLANTTKIRFYRRPAATIVETLSPIYTIVSGSKVESNIVSSFANVTLSNLDTFAGDVKRIKVYRTSEGDISDYDMIQDILLESKELLTSYELTGSVIGEAGLMTSEVLQKLWSYPTLTTQLTSSRIDNGVKLNGNGYFKYTSSLQLSANSVYEFGIDAFYSASTNSDMNIYISGSNNGEVLVGTLNGISPTKNLSDSVIEFRLPLDEPTASLYLSQSQSEWHIGNLSLKLTQDTAFSPSEISFVTSMPTVVGNETYNFKFEFYDVNNNYVPVLVTKSALFTGGNNNIGGTLIFISASASSSLGQLYAVSSSISGTATLYSSSANTTIVTLSGSVSGSITTVSGSVVTLSGSVSGSITNLSSSVSASITSLSSSVSSSNAVILSSSFAQVKNLADGRYSGSFIGDTVIYSPTIGGQQGYISDLFKVGTSPSIYLDARQNPRKIFIGGVTDSGSYNNSNTSVYMDSTGKFSLKDKLTWDGTTLGVNGTINVTGGNAATDVNALLYSQRAAASASISASAAQSNAASDATTKANAAYNNATAQLQSLADGGYSGSFIGSTTIYSPNIGGQNGYISNILKVGQNGITLDGGSKKIYVGTGTYANANTPFYFASGSTNIFSLGDKLSWDGNTLGITGEIVITAGSTKTAIDNAASVANAATASAAAAQSTANTKITAGGAASDVNSNTTTISGGKIRTGIIESTGYSYSSGTYSTAGMQINLDNGAIRSRGFAISSAGDAQFSGSISGSSIIGGTVTGGSITGGSINIGGGNFTVNSAGILTARDAILSGSVNAQSGQIGSWIIDGTTLRDANSSIKLDPTARSINILNNGVVKTTLNGNTVLSNPFAADIYLGDLPNITGQINTSFSISSNTTSTDSTFYTSYSSNFSVGQAGPVKLTMSTGNIAVGGSIPYGYAYCGGASGGGISVTGDTLITMYNGSYKLAKDIVANDLIQSWDWRNNKNQIIKTPVTGILKRTINKIYVVTIGDLVLKVSESHGFWLDNNEEIKVNDLIPNQTEIYVIDGDTIIKKIVDNVEIIYENVDVFTLHIDETNNYISNGILSHNPAPGFPGGTADYSGIRGYGYLQIYAEFYNNTNGQSVLAYLGGANKYGGFSYCDAGVTQYSNGYDAPKAASYGEVATFTIPSIGSYKWRYKIVVGVRPAESADYYGEYTPENTTFTATVGNLQNWAHSTSPGLLNLPTNIVEVTNAGIQILNDATTYLKMPRFDSSTSWGVEPLIQTRGGYGAYFEGKYDTTYGYSRCLYLAGQVYLSDSLGSGFESNIFPRYNSGQSCGQSDKKWSTIYASSATINTSDRNQKKEIEESDLGINLINKLKPVKYKFIENSSNRFHYGLIAQDVSGSLNELGVETKDFAGYIEMDMYTSGSNKISNLSSLKEEDDIPEWKPIKEYGLRYEEFISPMIKAIQQLSAKVDELEARISGSI